MPATKQEILKVRQELNEKTPLLYQAELFHSFQYVKEYENRLIKPNTLNDLKLALMKEALDIWKTEKYDATHLKKILTDVGGWENVVFTWLIKIKKERLKALTTSTDILDKFINDNRAGLPYIYEDFNGATAELETAKTTAEASLNEYKEKLGTETPEQIKGKLTALEEAKKKAEQDKATAEQDLKDLQKAAGEKAGKDNIKITELEQANKDKAEEIKKLKEQQATGSTETNNKLFSVSRKLMAIYNEQIKEATELFYQDLSLDNNWINEKYGNKDKSYLYYLARTMPETEPEQVINAFKIVALITATEKAQEKSDKHKNIAGLKPNIKKMNLKRFNKVKEMWDTIEEDGEPKEENNPLYLPVIKEKQKYIDQINKIISIWQ